MNFLNNNNNSTNSKKNRQNNEGLMVQITFCFTSTQL